MTQIGLNDLNQFIAGTKAVASKVNENFTVIKAAHNDTDSNVTAIQTTLQDVIMADGSKDFTRLQSYKLHTITNATNATPIVITSALHEFLTGDTVQVSGIEGNAAANGTFTITKVDKDSFSLNDSVGDGSYSSGGVALPVPTEA
jgi:phosphomevalonate kinase